MTTMRMNRTMAGSDDLRMMHTALPPLPLPPLDVTSADADDALEDVRGGPGEEAYVIGGVVDRQTRKPGASLHRADSSGIRPVRLPTAGVLETPPEGRRAELPGVRSGHDGLPCGGPSELGRRLCGCARDVVCPAPQVRGVEGRLRAPEQATEPPEVPMTLPDERTSPDDAPTAAISCHPVSTPC